MKSPSPVYILACSLMLVAATASAQQPEAPTTPQDDGKKASSASAPAPANTPNKDPFGFETIKQSMEEAKSGSVSPGTLKSLREIQERGQKATEMLKRQELGLDVLQRAKMLSIHKNYAEADLLFRKALELRQKAYGRNDWLCVEPLSGLAETYAERGWKAQAAQLYEQSIAISEKAVASTKPTSSDVLESSQANMKQSRLLGDLSFLGRCYEDSGKLAEAEAAYKKGLAYAKQYPNMNGMKMGICFSYAQLLKKMHRDGEAMQLEAEARKH